MVAPYSLHGFTRAGKSNGHSFKWKDNVLWIFANFSWPFRGTTSPEPASSATAPTEGHQQQEKAQDEFSNEVLHVRFCRQNGKSDSGHRRHLGDSPSVCAKTWGTLKCPLHLEPDLFETGALSKFLALAGGSAAPRETGKLTSEDQVVY